MAGTASAFTSPGLTALAQRVQGAVRLAEGDGSGGLALLRASFQAWQQLDAPYEAARTRVLLADAYRAVGDTDAAGREAQAARAAFERLGASADLRRLEPQPAAAPPVPCGLTAREIEVVQLIASGKSNRAIATDLFLSEKTVARHVSNIFTKTGMSSRTGVTAFAFENGLARTQ